jgi:quinol monooxygenase YgiN
MGFKHEEADNFRAIFLHAQALIAAFPGCYGVELLQDTLHPNRFFTYSTWEDHAALESYRQSELFASTWAKTKILFNEKPEAWSLQRAAE